MYKLSQLLSHYYWQENIKKENPAPNNEEQKAAVLIMSPVEEPWLVFRTAAVIEDRFEPRSHFKIDFKLK